MVRLRDSWPFSLSSAPTVGNPCRPLQPESVSDLAIGAAKPANNDGRPSAELVEQRAGAEGNAGQDRTRRAQNRVSVSQGLDRVRHVLPSDTQGGSRVPELGPLGSGAARLAAIPAGESRANRGVQCCCSHIQRREG